MINGYNKINVLRGGLMSTTGFGRSGEDYALDYLEKKGMSLLARNVRSSHGEIDLIVKDGCIIVFVEVKARRNRRYGEPIEAVTIYKQQHIKYTARMFLYNHHLTEASIRYDVVEVMMIPDRTIQIRHVKDAFR